MSKGLNVLKYGYWKGMPIHTAIKQFFVNIKLAYQRITRGYCMYDTWDETFMVKQMRDMIQKRIDNCDSYPSKLGGVEEWIVILEEIRNLFDEYLVDYDDTDEIRQIREEAAVIYSYYKQYENTDEVKAKEYYEQWEKKMNEASQLSIAGWKQQQNILKTAWTKASKWWVHIFW